MTKVKIFEEIEELKAQLTKGDFSKQFIQEIIELGFNENALYVK